MLAGSSGQVSFQVAQAAPYVVQSVTGQAAVLNYIAATGGYTLNGPDNPAKVGSIVSVYLTGVGPVSNPPADGAAASLTQLSYSTLLSTATATISGWSANVGFLGLAPGWVGFGPSQHHGTWPKHRLIRRGTHSRRAVQSNGPTCTSRNSSWRGAVRPAEPRVVSAFLGNGEWRSHQKQNKCRDDSRHTRQDCPGWCTGKPRHGSKPVSHFEAHKPGGSMAMGNRELKASPVRSAC